MKYSKQIICAVKAIIFLLLILTGAFVITKLTAGIVAFLFINSIASSVGFDRYSTFYFALLGFSIITLVCWNYFGWKWNQLKNVIFVVILLIGIFSLQKIIIHNRIGIVENPKELRWFNPDGTPLLYYSRDKNNALVFFNHGGINPYSGLPLTPVSVEFRAECEKHWGE